MDTVSTPRETAIETVRSLAYRYRAKLLMMLAGALTGSFLMMWFAVWADHQHGWEASVLYFVFSIVGTIMLGFSLFVGAALYQWHQLSSVAIRCAERYVEDPEWFKSVYQSVIGPFPW